MTLTSEKRRALRPGALHRPCRIGPSEEGRGSGCADPAVIERGPRRQQSGTAVHDRCRDVPPRPVRPPLCVAGCRTVEDSPCTDRTILATDVHTSGPVSWEEPMSARDL